MTAAAGTALLVLSSVFVVAAGTKLRGPIAFRAILRALVPPPLVLPLGLAVPIIEIAISGGLLLGPTRRSAAIAAAVLLTLFCLTLGRMWRLRLTHDCGCFGESSGDATPQSGLARNALLLAAAGLVIASPAHAGPWDMSISDAAAAATAAIGLVCSWQLLHLAATNHRPLFDAPSHKPSIPPLSLEEPS